MFRPLSAVCGILFLSTSVWAKAPEWTYSNQKNNFTMTIRSSACFENDELAFVSLNWYGSDNDVTVSADASCACDEAMQINGNLLISPNSFAKLVTDGLPSEFRNYMCIPVDSKD